MDLVECVNLDCSLLIWARICERYSFLLREEEDGSDNPLEELKEVFVD